MKDCPRNDWKIANLILIKCIVVQKLIMIISNVQIAFLPPFNSVLALIEKNF